MFTHGNNCVQTIKLPENIHNKTIIISNLSNLIKQMNYD